MCVVGGVFSLILSIMGCLTVKFKNPLVTTPFVICSFIIAILCMAVGGVVMSADVRQQACFTKFKLKDGKEVTGNILAKEYIQFVDKSMCSKLCPCPAADQSGWKDKVKEDDLKKYERTWTAANIATPFKSAGTKVPMQFGTSCTGCKNKEYKTFTSCYDEQIKGKVDNSDYSESYKNA